MARPGISADRARDEFDRHLLPRPSDPGVPRADLSDPFRAGMVQIPRKALAPLNRQLSGDACVYRAARPGRHAPARLLADFVLDVPQQNLCENLMSTIE